MNKSDFYYDLPEELIAQTPADPRDSSRLLIYDGVAESVEHRFFYDLPKYLCAGDVLVVNNTKVLPARIYGIKQGTGARVEFLLLRRLDFERWEVILKPGKKAHPGTVIVFSDELKAEILDSTESGGRIVRFLFQGVFEDILHRIGTMPLPPYIHEKLQDQNRYQTVYSKVDGSSAAPTAGLHFTDRLLVQLRDMGVSIVEVLLHVGLGTFRPVKTEDILQHKMHSEYYEVSEDAAAKLNAAKSEGRRIIAVGTTSVRTLESAAAPCGTISAQKGNTQIFIYPGYRFKMVDALITNFHLPESTLIMLVSALIGREKTLELYRLAVSEKYRFFSFGDAMFLK